MKHLRRRWAIIGVLVLGSVSSSGCVLWTQAEKGKTHAEEQILLAQLKKIREAINSYTNDMKIPPQELEDLVRADYLPIIPIDPITGKPDWVPVFYECPPSPCMKGIKDVHSSSKLQSSDGRLYAQW